MHVVHNGEPVGTGANISSAQVASQIEVLNEDFLRKPESNGFNTNAVGVDSEIEFYLAGFSPHRETLTEPGINRVNGGRESWPKGPVLNPTDTLIKPITIWPPEEYFTC